LICKKNDLNESEKYLLDFYNSSNEKLKEKIRKLEREKNMYV
jgi:hypothetical protein